MFACTVGLLRHPRWPSTARHNGERGKEKEKQKGLQSI